VKNLLVFTFALIFPPFNVAAEDEHSDMHDLMAHLLTPASEAIWESSGYVITEEGEFSLEPKNEEEWERVLYGAKVITESAYLLNIPSRSENRKEWIVFAGLLEEVGEKAFEAAEQKDVEALFKIGAELYQVCVACHQVYMNE
jgi:hypothetical protein